MQRKQKEDTGGEQTHGKTYWQRRNAEIPPLIWTKDGEDEEILPEWVAAECESALVTLRSELALSKVAILWICGQGHAEHREQPPSSAEWPLTWHEITLMAVSYFDPSLEPPLLVFHVPAGRERSEGSILVVSVVDHENKKDQHPKYLIAFAKVNCLPHSRWSGGITCLIQGWFIFLVSSASWGHLVHSASQKVYLFYLSRTWFLTSAQETRVLQPIVFAILKPPIFSSCFPLLKHRTA